MKPGRKLNFGRPLGRYCSKHNITMNELANIVGISVSQIYKINRNYDSGAITVESVAKIYEKTSEVLGDGLTPDRYLSKRFSQVFEKNDLSSSSGDSNGEPQNATRETPESAEEGLDDPYIEHINNEVKELNS